MMTILEKILETKKEEVAIRKRKFSIRELEELPFARRECLSMRGGLSNSPSGIIAEFKRKSPSKGYIHENAVIEDIVGAYTLAGASVCSVLTDNTYFGGNLPDLALARKTTGIPLLRKDFMIDEYQITEAKAYGADAILLIAAALSPRQCSEFTAMAHGLGLEVLLEIHQEDEMDRIIPEVDMVGVNNRNLATFKTDIYTSFELVSKIPACHLKVSESGIHSPETILALRAAGFRGFLIGEYFMRERQPGEALKKMIDHVV